MGATNSSNNISKQFIDQFSRDYPGFIFRTGAREHWSPQSNTIFYNPSHPCSGLVHELAHAILNHSSYQTDFELLRLESEAWRLATIIGEKYNIVIEESHIQNCLDTYRDWLHRRSTCPTCGSHGLQQNSSSYYCFNCSSTWHVSNGRFVRPYRKSVANS